MNIYLHPFSSFKSLKIHRPVKKCKPLSYTRAREILFSALRTVGSDESLYDFHSLRSGGVSAAAKNNVSDKLLQAHVRWASDWSKDD